MVASDGWEDKGFVPFSDVHRCLALADARNPLGFGCLPFGFYRFVDLFLLIIGVGVQSG